MTTRLRLTEHEVDAILRVAHARSREVAGHRQLRCVQIADGWALATDSYRLAAHPFDLDGPPWWCPPEWVDLLPDDGGVTVELGVDRQWLQVDGGRVEACRYPDFRPLDVWGLVRHRRYGATPPGNRVTVDRAALLRAIAKPFKAQFSSLVGMGSGPYRKVFVAGDEATAVETDFDPWQEGDRRWLPPLVFDAAFLRSTLRAHEDDRVTIEAWDSRSPVVIQEADADGDGLLQLLMPIIGGMPPALAEALSVKPRGAAA